MSSTRTAIFGLAAALAFTPSAWGQSAAAKAAERLGVLLDPAGAVDGRGFATAPKPRNGPANIERPEADVPRVDVAPPRPPFAERKPLRPRMSPEPSFLTVGFGQPAAPPKAPLATGQLVKQFAPDVQKPAPLPILGAYVRDRVSVADPSLEISALAILKPRKPARFNPVAFSPWNLPDPFEHAHAIRLREPWPESLEPPLFIVSPTRR